MLLVLSQVFIYCNTFSDHHSNCLIEHFSSSRCQICRRRSHWRSSAVWDPPQRPLGDGADAEEVHGLLAGPARLELRGAGSGAGRRCGGRPRGGRRRHGAVKRNRGAAKGSTVHTSTRVDAAASGPHSSDISPTSASASAGAAKQRRHRAPTTSRSSPPRRLSIPPSFLRSARLRCPEDLYELPSPTSPVRHHSSIQPFEPWRRAWDRIPRHAADCPRRFPHQRSRWPMAAVSINSG